MINANSFENEPVDTNFCILCGEEKILTGEHVFAAWIARHIKYEAVFSSATFSANGYSATTVEDRSARGGHGNATIKVLCKECNNEWSSALQNEISILVKPILLGGAFWFSDIQRRNLAVWVTLFAVVRQFLHPQLVAIHAPERLQFRNKAVPLPGLVVWIAPFHGENENLTSWYRGMHMHTGSTTEAELVVKNTFLLTFAMGKLLFVAFGTSDRGQQDLGSTTRIAMGRCARALGLTQLWPTFSVFPKGPLVSLGDDELMKMVPTLQRSMEHPEEWIKEFEKCYRIPDGHNVRIRKRNSS